MLISASIYILSAIISIFADLLSLITLAIPQDFQNSVAYFAGYLNYFGGLINLPALLASITWFFTFLCAWYTLKALLWGWRLVRPGKAT